MTNGETEITVAEKAYFCLATGQVLPSHLFKKGQQLVCPQCGSPALTGKLVYHCSDACDPAPAAGKNLCQICGNHFRSVVCFASGYRLEVREHS